MSQNEQRPPLEKDQRLYGCCLASAFFFAAKSGLFPTMGSNVYPQWRRTQEDPPHPVPRKGEIAYARFVYEEISAGDEAIRKLVLAYIENV